MSVPFLDTKAFDCRFPVAGEGVGLIVCGKRQKEGSSYCPDCHRRVFLKAPKLRDWRPGNESVPSKGKGDDSADLVELFAA